MAIGNPWGAAAQSYGQGVDQLTKIQMGGMQQAAQMPLQLYDRFMDGYEKARQRAAQEKAEELRQAQFERQQKLAEETLRHNMAMDTNAQERNKLTDQRAMAKEAMDALGTYNARIKGSDQTIMGLFGRAGLPAPELPRVIGSEGGEELPGPTMPQEVADERGISGATGPIIRNKWEDELSGYGPIAREKVRTQLREEKRDESAAMDRAENMQLQEQFRRDKLEADREDKKLARENQRVGWGMAAAGRENTLALRKEAQDAPKRAKVALSEGKLAEATADIDSLLDDIKDLKNHENLKPSTGAMGLLYRKVPGTSGRSIDTLVDTIKNKTLISTMSKLKSLSPVGSTGMGPLSDKEGETLRNSLVNWDFSVGHKTVLERIAKAEELLQAAKTRAIENHQRTAKAYFPDDEQAPTAPNGPKKGDIEDGYEFLGGDPKDKKNWKKVK